MRTLILTILLLTVTAHAATLHVSPNGDDTNPATREAPLKTIAAANDRMNPGDTAIIHAGLYRESIHVTKHNLTFRAAPNARVTISGTDLITSVWRSHKDGIYKTTVQQPVRQLLADSQLMIEAQFPNLSLNNLWDRNRWAKAAKGSLYGKMVDPQLAESNINWTGAVATLNVAHQFYTWTRTVKKHSAGSDRFEYEKDLTGITHFADKTEPWEDDRYYLRGKLEALDIENEWFYDAPAKTLYFKPPDRRHPSTFTLESKTRPFAFHASNINKLTIDGFNIIAATISLSNCNHATIANTHILFPNQIRRINDPEADEFDLAQTLVSGNDNTVTHCSFAFGPAKGIAISGRRNILENSLFHDFCWDGSLREPIIAINSSSDQAADDRCIVRFCTVYNGGNALINYRGLPGHIIEYNHFYNGGLACKDVALVYTGQPTAAGSVVRYNYVHGCYTEHAMQTDKGPVPGGLGIRGDDQTRSLTVHHNVVWDCGRDGIIVKGDNNRVFNNTVLNIGAPGKLNEPHVLGNYVNLHIDPEPEKWWRNQYPLLKVQNEHSLIANNVARTISGHNRVRPYPFTENLKTNFTETDPKLVDPTNYDFRPQPDSPLVDAGTPIPSFSHTFEGEAPDIGAFEYNAKPWTPGITWNPTHVLGQTPPGYINLPKLQNLSRK